MFRGSRTARALALCLVLVAAAALTAACSDDTSAADTGKIGTDAVVPQPGDAAADALSRPYETFDGAETTLASYAGHPLVVNFFASWCTPCVTEMPDFEAVHQELGDRVTFVGMNYGAGGETLSGAKDIVARTRISYDVGRDTDGSLLQAFGGVTMPTTVFVRPDGSVAKVRSGAISKGDLRNLISQELGVS
jgi:thiol-disulfide isomerase/thioredoxin